MGGQRWKHNYCDDAETRDRRGFQSERSHGGGKKGGDTWKEAPTGFAGGLEVKWKGRRLELPFPDSGKTAERGVLDGGGRAGGCVR